MDPYPLRLERLWLDGFRNLTPLEQELGSRFNVFAGDNAQGKSNLLEAIYFLGSLKSFRGAGREDLIAKGGDAATLHGIFDSTPSKRDAKIGLDRKRARKIQLDGKRPRSNAVWVGALPMVLFHPGDLSLAGGGPDGRRGFLDRILEQIDEGYSVSVSQYVKALRSRNRLLKDPAVPKTAIAAYDPILAEHGANITRLRDSLVTELAPETQKAFSTVSGSEDLLRVSYQPRVAPSVDAIRAALAEAYVKDRARGFTADGPHSDDLALEVATYRAKHHASQGQQRMIVLSLKIAELLVLSRRTGLMPPLLLDDVSSELDRTRSARFFELLEDLGAQVFLTTTQPELIRLPPDNRVDFEVVSGRVESSAG